MVEPGDDHTGSQHSVDDLFQLLVHARGILPDTEAKGQIERALRRGDLQVDSHIRGGARSTRRIREPTPEELRKFEILGEKLHRREASEKEMREEMDLATAFLYEHAPPEGITGPVHRESWEPGNRVFSLTIENGCLKVLFNCGLDYPWDAYSFTIKNWWMVDELWPLKPPAPTPPAVLLTREVTLTVANWPTTYGATSTPTPSSSSSSSPSSSSSSSSLPPVITYEERVRWLHRTMRTHSRQRGEKLDDWCERLAGVMEQDSRVITKWTGEQIKRRRLDKPKD